MTSLCVYFRGTVIINSNITIDRPSASKLTVVEGKDLDIVDLADAIVTDRNLRAEIYPSLMHDFLDWIESDPQRLSEAKERLNE